MGSRSITIKASSISKLNEKLDQNIMGSRSITIKASSISKLNEKFEKRNSLIAKERADARKSQMAEAA